MHEINHHEMHGKPHDADTRIIFGFWVYVMSDCVLFASIFATYAVLHGNTFGGPSARELFSLPFVLTETLLLLTSSFTYGMAMVAGHHSNKTKVLYWLLATFVLGGAFLTMEVTEFAKMIGEGSGPERSGFLSAFFTLVGTHGLHVTLGLVWMGGVAVQVWRRGLTSVTLRKLTMLSLFWHFLDIIWIFIFTVVYLMGVI
jgi:cytochrome o ubiquinol oxidase subunit 3